MPVCQYFLAGRCRYGENCRNEHPRGGAQRNLFGGGDPNWQGREGSKVSFRDNYSAGGQSQNNPYKWSANSQGSSNQLSTVDVLDDLPKSMEIWEKSKMWPFSCLSLDAHLPSIPEFYDTSMEELRWDAYQALQTDTMQSYIQKYRALQNEFANKRNQLKHMTMDMKRKLMTFLEEARKNLAVSAGSTASFSFQSTLTQSNLFGQSRTANESGVFSQSSSSSGLFGKPGATGSQTGLFGKPAGTGSVFGGNSLMPGGSPFGSAASATGSSVFGNINVQNSFGGAVVNSGFSNASTTSSAFGTPGTSLFGKPVEQKSIFGGQMVDSSSNKPFGAANPSSSLNVFGGDSSTQTGLFGGGPSANPVRIPYNGPVSKTAGLFGKPDAGANASSPFGNTIGQQQTSGLFGSTTNSSFFTSAPNPGQQTGSLFGSPQAQSSLNQGGPQNSGGLFGKGTPVPSTTLLANDAFSGCYTPLSDLTDQEKEAFNAQSFQLGKIPLRPPPVELIRNH